MALAKRSFTLSGHRTSLALEPEFWRAVETIAAQRGLSLPALIAAIDAKRQDNSLAGAVRIHALEHFRGNA